MGTPPPPITEEPRSPAPEQGAPKSQVALLEKWHTKAKAYRDAHYLASVRLRRVHYSLGVPAIILSAVVGTAVFATLEKSVSLTARVGVAAVSVIAAVLSALQTFLRFSERAEAHRQAYAGYDSVVREIEWTLTHADDRKAFDAGVGPIRERFDSLASSPELSEIDRTMVLRSLPRSGRSSKTERTSDTATAESKAKGTPPASSPADPYRPLPGPTSDEPSVGLGYAPFPVGPNSDSEDEEG